AYHLRQSGITYEVLSGEMTTKARMRVTNRVADHTSPNPRLGLMPLRLGVGINGLQGTAAGGGAKHSLFLDGYWNDATERQALGRALRPGQSRHVFSTKFLTYETVEE